MSVEVPSTETRKLMTPNQHELNLCSKIILDNLCQSCFYHGPLVKRGRDKGMAILLLLLLLFLQSSIRTIRAKYKTRCSALIG